MPIHGPHARLACLFAAFATLAAQPLTAQSLSTGGLIATISDDRGTPLRGVTVTIERRGTAFRIVESDAAGQVILAALPIGRYNILAEQLGFQPVRALDASVVTGAISRVNIQLVRRPPPINTITEQPADPIISSATTGQTLDARALELFARRRDATDAPRALSSVDAPRDGRDGFVASAGGLAPSFTKLMVDGVEEALLRHPGLPGDASSAPIWSRDGADQALVSWLPADAEFRSAQGTLLSLTSKRGENRFSIHPYAAFSSAQFGGAAADNPADSSASSIEAGITLSGPLKGDTAVWFLRADYRQLAEPAADPFVIGTTDPTSAILAAAEAHGGSDATPWLAPTVRRWEGGSALGRIDWQLAKTAALGFRIGGASWTEDNPQAGVEAVNGAGARLEASDFSSAMALVIDNPAWVSETRIGFRSTSRDWFGAALPFTGFVGEGVAIGGAGTLPGLFKESAIEVNEAFTIPSGIQTIKVGGNVQRRDVTYDWMPGSAGRYNFGGVAGFATDSGAFYQAFRSGAAPEVGVTRIAIFLEDALQLTKSLQISGGLRAETSALPTDVIDFDNDWGRVSGLRNDFVPERKGVFALRGGVAYTLDKAGRTILHGEAGMLPGEVDLVSLAEVVQYDGDVTVRRATGALAWPGVASGSTAPLIGPSITYYDAGVRAPTSFKSEAGLSHDFGKGTSLSLTGGYGHVNYLLRRSDANLAVAPTSTSSDGRSIWGTLEQYGAMLTPAVGSNRRFSEIDMAYGLTSTGYSDFFSMTVGMERRVISGLQLQASYTYSKTEDNLVGQFSADPADRLSPFPDAQGIGDWDSGRSDLDIPHRIAATIEYRSAGTLPLSVAARFRFRSGLPFTPGFQRGVDANGDGSSANDPAFLGNSIPGMSELRGNESCLSSQAEQFAERNSCREPGVSALDLRGQLGLGRGGTRHVALTLDLFNLVGTETGLYDHAAVLVNPAGSISVDGAGHTVLPLLANQNFGQLLVRRGEGRMLRVGLRVEN